MMEGAVDSSDVQSVSCFDRQEQY